MAQTTTVQLLPQTAFNGSNTAIVGERQPAAAYYLGNQDLQTVTWSITNVTGLISIQASLVDNPTSNDDWFIVYNLSCTALTQSSFININGNFVWIRAIINGFTQGVVQNIKMSY